MTHPPDHSTGFLLWPALLRWEHCLGQGELLSLVTSPLRVQTQASPLPLNFWEPGCGMTVRVSPEAGHFLGRSADKREILLGEWCLPGQDGD